MAARALFLAIAIAARAHAQESSATLENPFTSDADIARGEKTFLSQCATCHGQDGRGGAGGPDVSTGQFRRTSTDEGLHRIISQGIAGTTMPAFSLNPGPTWQVVAYLRSLSRGRRNAAIAGDAARGGALFRARCAVCHPSSAPQLAGLGARRSVDELRTAILDPQREVHDSYWRARVTLRDGRTHSGMRLNEDTFTIQLRDEKGALLSLPRSTVARVEYDRTSPMPSFRGKLNDSELNDILAFVFSMDAP